MEQIDALTAPGPGDGIKNGPLFNCNQIHAYLARHGENEFLSYGRCQFKTVILKGYPQAAGVRQE